MAQAKRRQKFFKVELPTINKETQMYGYELNEFNGKSIIYDLSRLLRGKSTTLRFKIKVKDNKATTEPVELKVMPQFIRRMIRKGTNYVEDSFVTECKNAKLKVKPFLITRKKVPRRVRKALRERCREEIIKYMKTKSSEMLFEEIMKNKLQKHLSTILKKIYPLAMCEIRTFTIKERPEIIKEESAKEETKKSKPKKEEEEDGN